MGMVPSPSNIVKENRPLCSVCIANYNGEQFIEQCIESVLKQEDFPGEVEIIVHDDASTDGSVDLIRTRYPQVRLLPSENNVGFCVSNNRMVAAARGEFILLLNNDAALWPDALKTFIAEAKALEQPAILSLPQYEWTTGALLDIGSMLDPFLNPVPNVNPERRNVGMVIGACLWIPKTMWEDLEGFPEWFGSIGEDLYLCCRARLAGYTVLALNRSGYKHQVGGSFGGGKMVGDRMVTSFRRRGLSEQNKTYIMVVAYPLSAMLLLLPLHLALLLIEGVLMSILQKRLSCLREIYLPVFKGLIINRSLLMDLRNRIMAQRSLGLFEFFAPFQLSPRKLWMFFRHGVPHIK
jgi:GT2 family glycosyltransferase